MRAADDESAVRTCVNQLIKTQCTAKSLPYHDYLENDVIPYIQGLGIVVQGWYPLGGRGHTGELLGNGTITAVAAAHDVSPAQVILRWNLHDWY